jgi:putative DNA primase/helicase
MIDLSKLEKPRIKNGKTIARCPACAETGNDTKADHLFINMTTGVFGCCLYQGSDGDQHRKRIFELVGIADEKPNKSTWTALPFAPDNAPEPSLRHYKHGNPSAHWVYKTQDGKTAGIIARFDLPNGKKETLPITWCKDQNGNTGWNWKAMSEPRPLYGLPLTGSHVVIVEGEKTADAVRSAGFECVTWSGGCAAVHKTDFSPLNGCKIVIWADNDQPGFRAMKSVASLIKADIMYVNIPNNMPEGWDAADTTKEEIARLINEATPAYSEPEPEIFTDTYETPSNRIADMPFRLLGMDDGIMRYMPDNGQHIVSISPAGHTKLNLLQLAPLHSWEMTFVGKPSVDWDAATNALIQLSQSLPKFDPRSIRGRGCWIDANDVIYHAGNKLAINGDIKPIPSYDSPTGAIYESGLQIAIDTTDAAKNAESAQLLALCETLCWDQPLYGKLLAGWMALSPICGALQWRPHIWVTGASGSGKTWIMGNIIYPVVGKSAVFVLGNTSEAGIRGQLGSDALPVLFDEAEAENQRSISRMDNVMELARQASSESGAGIVKGTQNGGSITYMVRSMFCFSSIGVAAVKKADTSRISVLSLQKSDSVDQFNEVKRIWKDTTACPKYCARIRARAVRNAKTTRHNADIFSQAAVSFTGDKRSADQVGTLLAGAFSLTSTKEISMEAATKWLATQDWSGFKVDSIDADENQCLAHLLSSIIRIERQGSTENISVDEAMTRIRTEASPEPEALALMRVGIKIEHDSMTVANSHQGLERLFTNTPWAGAKWRGQLLRIPGASVPPNPVRFGSNVRQRAVLLPV